MTAGNLTRVVKNLTRSLRTLTRVGRTLTRVGESLTRAGKTQQGEQIQFYIELRLLFSDLLFIKRVQ